MRTRAEDDAIKQHCKSLNEVMSRHTHSVPGKRLELYHKAMLAVTDWMAAFEGASGRGPVVSDMGAIENLERQLKAALEEDETARADLLAVCEEFYDAMSHSCPDYYGMFVASGKARAVIAKTKETR